MIKFSKVNKKCKDFQRAKFRILITDIISPQPDNKSLSFMTELPLDEIKEQIFKYIRNEVKPKLEDNIIFHGRNRDTHIIKVVRYYKEYKKTKIRNMQINLPGCSCEEIANEIIKLECDDE